MPTVLLVLITTAAVAACLLTALMFYRDEPLLGVYGLALALLAGMISMPYSVVAFG